MNRIALKVTGAQGQGVNSVGEMCAKGLKRAGYCVFGYKEYMSLIKGGHSSYQIDFSDERLESTQTMVDILVCFNHHGLEINTADVKDGGVILHQSPDWAYSLDQQNILREKNISVICLPTEDFLRQLTAPPILGNVLITTVVWALLGRSSDEIKELVKEQFGHKGEKLLTMNYAAVDVAMQWAVEHTIAKELTCTLPVANKDWSDDLLITGSEAMGLGLVHGGCRLYAGYPMTPSSQLLGYIAGIQNDTGMIIKQAEDEITAAQVMSGAMMMGTRAATGTSGGGFDLMTETVSMNAMMENPSLFILAQRPGPATGLPTWTAQGDLLLAVHSAHGEFARLVIGVSDSQDCFDLMPVAFNYAEEFQTPVIVMTDKQIAEALYTQSPYDQKKAEILRGELLTAPKAAKMQSVDRYETTTKTGITPRWLPGTQAETFCSQGDEHNEDGSVDEGSANAIAQMNKRMRKMEALKNALPEPEYFGAKNPDILVVSWGSNKGVIIDALKEVGNETIGYLHYTYLWPLQTETFENLHSKAKKTVLVECNYQGQLGMLLKMECGKDFDEKILKYDGRPFFVDELRDRFSAL